MVTLFKKFATTVLVLTIAFAAAACSSNSDKKEESAAATGIAATASASAPADETASKAQAYIAARLAEEKVEGLFHQETSADGKSILNPITPDKDAAVKFLNAYIDSALSEKIVTYYLTEEKADGAIVVKSDKFLSVSIRGTASKDEVAFEGTPEEYKLSTKDGGVYTVKKNAEGKYLLADYAKQ
ncbi:hypothetical protein [Cohnella candidum]|uniref:Lipoprotein n=1 Tax=Cohnella candidum TaxID=2674991 RepID=A0A3G3JYX8_9BACL|nr:hypothetical protein [Cohnella candidum]AYQ73362.1 hypothetical protein EAV92_12740 [Cohnella candidum]